ncbi:MAG: DUF2285 domain-containing protein, partial [Sphingomonas sp.]
GFPRCGKPAGAFQPAARLKDRDACHLVIDHDGVRHRVWLHASEHDDRLVILLPPTDSGLRVAATDSARQLLAGCGKSGLAAVLQPSAFQRQRLALLLAVLDASLAGKATHAIALQLVFPWLADMSAAAWKASNERRRVQRLIAESAALMLGGYRDLLAG